MLIEHIYAIARKKQRDVLYVTFKAKKGRKQSETSLYEMFDYDWRKDRMRKKVCQWLTRHSIDWQPCGHIASENMMVAYRGQIYLDIPYDENDPNYCLARDYLEYPNGSMRFKTVDFWLVPLAKAMENVHHDEPGFWEKWAENF